METKYGPIFLVCVIVGAIFLFVPRGGFFAGGLLINHGMKGLLIEQQIAKEEIEHQRAMSLRQQIEKERQADHDRQMGILRLLRPATPEEGY